MSLLPARPAGPILLAAGGILIALGSFTPEILRTGSDRSHWIVFREDLDMLAHPDPNLPGSFSTFYFAEACGLAYPVLAGVLIAAIALLPRSRAAGAAAFLFHAFSFWVLAAAALALAATRVSEVDEASSKTAGKLLGGAALLTALLLIEIAAAHRAVRPRGRRRGPLAIAVSLPPAAFLFILNAGLFVAFRKHPNWPSAGYAVGAAGALLALAGMVLGRVQTASPSVKALSTADS